MDLLQLARDNSPNVEAGYVQLLASLTDTEREVLEQFCSMVTDRWRASLNMRPSALASFLRLGSHQNMHEWAEARSALVGVSADEVLRGRLGAYYTRRLAFDDTFDNGHAFRYTALNAGGTGAARYGPLCIILNRALARDDRSVACLRRDSLDYVGDDGSVNTARINAESATPDAVHLLATLKCATDALQASEDQWAAIVCSDDGYVEVILTNSIDVDALDEVRLSADEHRRMLDCVLASWDPKARLTEPERALVEACVEILSALSDARIKLEVMEDA